MALGDIHTAKPKSCPKCNGRKLIAVPETISGLKPWRCEKCGAIGYRDRVVGDKMLPEVEKKPLPVRRRKKMDRYGAQKPKRTPAIAD